MCWEKNQQSKGGMEWLHIIRLIRTTRRIKPTLVVSQAKKSKARNCSRFSSSASSSTLPTTQDFKTPAGGPEKSRARDTWKHARVLYKYDERSRWARVSIRGRIKDTTREETWKESWWEKWRKVNGAVSPMSRFPNYKCFTLKGSHKTIPICNFYRSS